MKTSPEYERPSLTVDCVVFGLDDAELKVLLIQRDLPPFEGCWALPGGFVHIDETVEQAAHRELAEETGVERVTLQQVQTFSALDRDPRGRVISVAHYGLVKLADHRVRSATDARDAAWFSLVDLPDLAFDHATIIDVAHARLKERLRHEPVGFELLPPHFSLSQLQHVYEAVWEEALDKRNFRKKILATGLVVETGELQRDVAHRAARLFRFDHAQYKQLARRGFLFEV